MTDLVSVIVPSHCHEQYVIECLQSIHAQTHERLELIVVDDASHDRTFEYVRALLATPFRKRFDNVILHRKSLNKGAPDSLNMGLKLANGKYVAVINSDDLFQPLRIERVLQAMRDAGSHLGVSLVDVFTDGDEAPIPDNLLSLQLRQQLTVAREPCLSFALLRWNVAISTGNFVCSLELAKKVGGFQPLRYCHDWDFALQAAVHTEPVMVDQALYKYRIHSQNSFHGYDFLAKTETKIVYRRFLKSVLGGRPPNPLCPGPSNWPGYFEARLHGLGIWDIWAEEAGLPLATWRIYEKTPWFLTTDAPGFA